MKVSRNLFVDWKSLDGAAQGRRKLAIRPNNKGSFPCPLLKHCLHADFQSARGLRKHINTKHPWYFYFDRQPEVKKENMFEEVPTDRKKAFTAKKPSFSLEEGIGLDFMQWLTTSCGGGKTQKEAVQVGKRTMKFFMQAIGNNDDSIDLTYDFVDCCLGSASIIISFLKTLEESWKMSSSGSLNYVKAIGDMVDFRKASGVSDATLRSFTITEVYIRRAKENLRKRKNVECTRNLDLETLMAKDSWATIEEMEQVVPFHLPRFKGIIESCRHNAVVTKGDLVFSTRFITTLMFLRVKCTRPMTFQYLTVNMIKKAKENDGFVDQTEFKTSATYLFDTLIFTQDVLDIIDMYIEFVRHRLSPRCDFVLLSSNGTQFQSLTNAMIMIVHQAIKRYINPTRYRQIIETESSERLTIEEQRFVSEDQKHSSQVAKIYYKKKHSRQVAIEGRKCMDKMTKGGRAETDNLIELFNNLDSGFDPKVLEKSHEIMSTIQPKADNQIMETNQRPTCSKFLDPYQPIMDDDLDTSTDFTSTPSTTKASIILQSPLTPLAPIMTAEIANETNVLAGKKPKNVKFTSEEDHFLNLGIQRYGRAAWASILKDEEFTFNEARTRDSLRIRANSAAFKKQFPS